jgi:hypothetical protein
LQFNCKLVCYCNIKFTGSKCCWIVAKAYGGHLENVKYFAVNLNVFDCCNAYYIVMQAIIESGYRTQTVQLFKEIFKGNEKNKVKLVHVVFG